MDLQCQLENEGAWLFQRRSYLPAALFLPLTASALTFHWPLGQHHLHENWEWICLGVTGTGLLIRMLVAGHVPTRTSGRNTKHQVADSLNTTGVYSLCRHPLYLGNFLIALGWNLLFLNGWQVTVFVLLFWLYYERIALAEESFLKKRHAHEFDRWAARTPAFLPRFSEWEPPALPFSCGLPLKICSMLYEGLSAHDGRKETQRWQRDDDGGTRRNRLCGSFGTRMRCSTLVRMRRRCCRLWK